MKKNEVIWEHGVGAGRGSKGGLRVVMTFDAGSNPFAVVVEHRHQDALGIDSWRETSRWSQGAGEGHAPYWLWLSVWEANAKKPALLAKSDANLLGVIRSLDYPAHVDEATDHACRRLLHRLQMVALRAPTTLDKLLDRVRVLSKEYLDQDGVNVGRIDDVAEAMHWFDKGIVGVEDAGHEKLSETRKPKRVSLDDLKWDEAAGLAASIAGRCGNIGFVAPELWQQELRDIAAMMDGIVAALHLTKPLATKQEDSNG